MNFKRVDSKNMYISDCGNVLKSYDKVIVVKKGGKTYLNADYHDFSKTTAKHRNSFLGVDSKWFNKNFKEGYYILVPDEKIMEMVL